MPRRQHLAHGLDGRGGLLAQPPIEDHFAPSPAGRVVNETARHFASEHLFQAKRLSAKLNVVVLGPAPLGLLVLDRNRLAVMQFDDVGLARQPVARLVAWLVGVIVQQRADDGVLVVAPDAFDVHQCASPWAEDVLVERRDRNQFKIALLIAHNYRPPVYRSIRLSLRPGQQPEFIADSLNLFRSENRAFGRTTFELENNGLLTDLLLIIIAPDRHRYAKQFTQHPRRTFVPDGRDKAVSNQTPRLFERKRLVAIRAEGGQD